MADEVQVQGVPSGLNEEKLPAVEGVPVGLQEEALPKTAAATASAKVTKEKQPGWVETANKAYEGEPAKPMAMSTEYGGNVLRRLGSSVGRTLMTPINMAAGAYHAAVDPSTVEDAGLDPQQRFVKRMAVDPSLQAIEQEKQHETADAAAGMPHSTAEKVLNRAVSSVPLVGPYVESEGQRAGRGDIVGAAADVAGQDVLGRLGHEAATQPLPNLKKAAYAPIRGLSKAADVVVPAAPYAAGAAIGHPLVGARVFKGLTEPLSDIVEAGKVAGLSPEEATYRQLDERAVKSEKEAANTQKDVDRYKRSVERGVQPPEDIVNANKKSQTRAAEDRFHADTAREAMEEAKAARPAAPDVPTEKVTAQPQKVEGVPAGLTEEAVPQPATEPKEVPAKAEEVPAEKRAGERRQAEVPVEEEKRTGERRNDAGLRVDAEGNPTLSPDVEGHWQAGAFGEKPVEDIGSKAREVNPEPTRAETKPVLPKEEPSPSELAKTVKGELIGSHATGKATPESDVDIKVEKPVDEDALKQHGYEYQSNSRVSPKEAAEYDKPIAPGWSNIQHFTNPTTGAKVDVWSSEVAPKEEPTGYAAKKEEVVPTGSEGREPVKSAAEYHPAVKQKVSELSDANLRQLAKAHGLNPDEYDFNARDERRHRTERDQLTEDIAQQMGEDEKINLGRAAEATEKQGLFQGADTSAKGRAARAEKMFPRLRGPVDEAGNPKVSGGSQAADVEAEKLKENVAKTSAKDTDHMQSAIKELGPDAKLSDITKRAQEMKDTHAQFEEHENNGVSTFSSKGKNLNGEDKYSVGSYPDRTEQVDKLTPERLEEFKKKNSDVLSKEDHAVGTWKDPDTGKAVLDVTKLYDGKDEAIAAGKAANQKAIYHLGGDGEIQTGGTGEGSFPDKVERPTTKGKALPTGDALVKKYGETQSNDPKGVAFILEDGRKVSNTGSEHDTMLGGKATQSNPPRERFVKEGNIRVREHQGAGGRTVAFSIPESGVNAKQFEVLKKMGPQLSSGGVAFEIGQLGGKYETIPHGEATTERMQQALGKLGEKKSPLGKIK